MKSLIIKLLVFLLLPVLLMVAPLAAQEKEEGENKTVAGLLEFQKAKEPEDFLINPMSPYLSPGPFIWSSFSGAYENGPHSLLVYGATVTDNENATLGEELQYGAFATTATYRYNGIFGGVIRPVARFTVGAGQTWGPVGGPGFSGYTPGVMTYAVPEAGVELTVKIKGRRVGVGITEAYMWQMQTEFYRQDDKYTGGVYAPQTGPNSWKDWFTKVYPVFE